MEKVEFRYQIGLSFRAKIRQYEALSVILVSGSKNMAQRPMLTQIENILQSNKLEHLSMRRNCAIRFPNIIVHS